MEIITLQWPEMIEAKPKLRELQAAKISDATIKELFSILTDYAREKNLIFIQVFSPFGYPETFVFRKRADAELIMELLPPF